ncbi:hypothetical protein LQ567_07075 [Niabella pedocola]|uniref:Uncharacterized protein n=1 Tax=Niabella pedocola TaxID=1752077 RepID=A0ABS8PN31_9BACT|nr:hypothetical protein [Niabella pedocola]MCD2422520.1 hypothetical protein [Niabella pedocola]
MKSVTRMIFSNRTDSKPGLAIANHREGKRGRKQFVTHNAVMEQETVRYGLPCFAAVGQLKPVAGASAAPDLRLTGHARG